MNKPEWTYICITFLITWGISISSYLFFRNGNISYNALNIIYNFGALGPFIGSIVSARIFYGTEGLKKLFSKLSIGTLDKKTWMIVLSPLLFLGIGLLFYPVIKGHWFSFEETRRQFKLTDRLSYINWLLPFITYSILEEFGWRGFLLPHLQERHTALKSTMILTIFWATWHLPFFLWRMQFSLFMTFGFFFAIYIGAIIITSAYNFSKGSIISVMLFHFCNNIASAIDKEFVVIVVSMCFVLVAVYIIRKYKPTNLADRPRVRNFYLHDS